MKQLALLVLIVAACAEPPAVTPTVGTAPRQIVPAVAITDSTTVGQVVLTLQVRASWPMGKVGSFTARLTYDSTALSFMAEEPIGDGGLRALNPVSPGLVRVAGAAAGGMDGDRLMSIRFRLVDTTSAVKMAAARASVFGASLQIAELHEVSRSDLSAMIVRPNAKAASGAKP